MPSIDLSIITVGYSSQQTLPILLSSIKQQQGCVFEFIYVENAPHDLSCQVVKEHFPTAMVVEPGVNLGFSKGCNLGAAEAQGEYLLFLNPDCEIKTIDTLHNMINFMKWHPNVGIGAPMYTNSKGGVRSGAFSKYIAENFFPCVFAKLPGHIAWVTGAALIISRDLFKFVGGFDERYFIYAEDMDICLSVRKAGFIISEIDEARVWHQGGNSSNRIWKREEVLFRMELASAIFTEKNYTDNQHKVIWKKQRLKTIYKLIKSCLIHPKHISLYFAKFRAANAIYHVNKLKIARPHL